MPEPAVIHCVSPSPMRPPPPFESWCSITPSMTYVTVSNPRCGCHGAPTGSFGAYSTGPSWSRRKNGSAMWVSMPPGNGRHTSNPAPSTTCCAGTTDATRRCTAFGPGCDDAREDERVVDGDRGHAASTGDGMPRIPLSAGSLHRGDRHGAGPDVGLELVLLGRIRVLVAAVASRGTSRGMRRRAWRVRRRSPGALP